MTSSIQFPAQLRFVDGGDAAVHADDEVHALGVKLVDGDGVQTVALLQPGGDVADAVCAHAAQKVREHAGGGDAVHIIVAEDGDFFAPVDGEAHPVDGLVHVRHQVGVGEGSITVEISAGLSGGVHAPGGQNHGGQGGVAAGHQRVDSSRLRCLDIPNSILQNNTHPL